MSDKDPWGEIKIATGEIIKMIEYDKYLALEEKLRVADEMLRRLHDLYFDVSGRGFKPALDLCDQIRTKLKGGSDE